MPDILSVTKPNPPQHRLKGQIQTWWLIPVGKWIITPVISELTLLSPVITRGITYLLSEVNHQVHHLQMGHVPWLCLARDNICDAIPGHRAIAQDQVLLESRRGM